MRKYLALLILLFPSISFAHGGVSKLIGGTIVSLNQNPLSPFVGESVQFAFTFTDTKYQQFKNLDLQLSVIDTAFNNPALDRTIQTSDVKTDVNGNFILNYSFPTSDYYDLEFTFVDPATGMQQTTGFLVQPRAVPSKKGDWLQFATVGITGIFIGIILARLKVFSIK